MEKLSGLLRQTLTVQDSARSPEKEIERLKDWYPNEFAHKLLQLMEDEEIKMISIILLKIHVVKVWAQLSQEIQAAIIEFAAEFICDKHTKNHLQQIKEIINPKMQTRKN